MIFYYLSIALALTGFFVGLGSAFAYKPRLYFITGLVLLYLALKLRPLTYPLYTPHPTDFMPYSSHLTTEWQFIRWYLSNQLLTILGLISLYIGWTLFTQPHNFSGSDVLHDNHKAYALIALFLGTVFVNFTFIHH